MLSRLKKRFKVSHSKIFHHFSKFVSDRFTQLLSLFSNLMEISIVNLSHRKRLNFILYGPFRFNMGHMEWTYVADKSSFDSDIFSLCCLYASLGTRRGICTHNLGKTREDTFLNYKTCPWE